jgi:16S rRNA (guanine966-N2)-methyltransferase
MRIIAGQWRGRKLTAPDGVTTRPTAERARQALFNRIEHAQWSPGLAGVHVLDLFAGTGALGLEALSRGAAYVTFVERDPTALKALRANINACGCGQSATVVAGDATTDWALTAPVAVIFADPPYGTNAWVAALSRLTPDRLADDAIAIIETGAAETPVAPAGWVIEDVRDYGAARTLILTRS